MQIGHSRLQWLVISMMGRQLCCSWSAQRPESLGQPWTTAVECLSGTEPLVMYVSDRRNHSASPEIRASDWPSVGHCLRRKTFPSRRMRAPSTSVRHVGQIPFENEWKTSDDRASGVSTKTVSVTGSFIA